MISVSERKIITICNGELAVSREPAVVLSAVLGSCVATCLYDPVARLGGMNHILLPGDAGAATQSGRYGLYAMEALINAMMKDGAQKRRMRARLFGGASTFDNALGIGAANSDFALGFLSREGIPVMETQIGGKHARRVRFCPSSGEASATTATATASAPPEAPRPAAGQAKSSGATLGAWPRRGPNNVEFFE